MTYGPFHFQSTMLLGCLGNVAGSRSYVTHSSSIVSYSEVVKTYRRRVACRCQDNSIKNVDILVAKFGIGKPELDVASANCPELLHNDPSTQQLIQDNTALLQQYYTLQDAKALILRAPKLLVAELESWFAFLKQYGFSDRQLKDLLAQSPEILTQASLVSAGEAMLHLQRLGLPPNGIINTVVLYPQVLKMKVSDISALMALLSKFS